MYKQFFLVVVHILFTSCQSVETRIEYFADGKIKSEAEYLGEKKMGWERLYYTSGHIRSKRFFQYDTLNGLSIYFKDGNAGVDSMLTYKNGKRNGEFIKFYGNGNVSEKGEYQNDYPVGKYYRYYPNDSGKIFYEAYLINVGSDVLQYWVKKFDQNGNVLDEQRSIRLHYSSPVHLGDTLEVRFEILDEHYDSAKIILGDFGSQSEPLDSLAVENGGATHKFIVNDTAVHKVKGKYIIYRNEISGDTAVNYATYGFFEEFVETKY